MAEKVEAVSGGEGEEGAGGRTEQSRQRAAGSLAEEGLELGESQFNGVEIGTVGGEVEELGPAGGHGFGGAVDLVTGKIVTDDQVAGGEFWGEDFLEIGDEHGAVHRTIDQERSAEPVMPQRGEEGGGLPVAVRHRTQTARAALGPAVASCEFGVEPRFVEEDQA